MALPCNSRDYPNEKFGNIKQADNGWTHAFMGIRSGLQMSCSAGLIEFVIRSTKLIGSQHQLSIVDHIGLCSFVRGLGSLLLREHV